MLLASLIAELKLVLSAEHGRLMITWRLLILLCGDDRGARTLRIHRLAANLDLNVRPVFLLDLLIILKVLLRIDSRDGSFEVLGDIQVIHEGHTIRGLIVQCVLRRFPALHE